MIVSIVFVYSRHTRLPALAPAHSSDPPLPFDRAQKCLEYFYWHTSCSFYKSINILGAWQWQTAK